MNVSMCDCCAGAVAWQKGGWRRPLLSPCQSTHCTSAEMTGIWHGKLRLDMTHLHHTYCRVATPVHADLQSLQMQQLL